MSNVTCQNMNCVLIFYTFIKNPATVVITTWSPMQKYLLKPKEPKRGPGGSQGFHLEGIVNF